MNLLLVFIFLCVYVCFLCFPRKDYFKGLIKNANFCKLKAAKNKYLKLNNNKISIINKLKYNFVTLSKQNLKFLDVLKSAGININFPIYKIEVENSNLGKLCKDLSTFKQIENLGFKFNLIINFRQCKMVGYNDVFYLVSKYNFFNIVKVQQVEFISSNLMFAVNACNVNTNNAPNIFCGKKMQFFVDSDGEKYFSKENYIMLNFKSQLKVNDVHITKTRTYNYIDNCQLIKLGCSNLNAKRCRQIKLCCFIPFNNEEGSSGLIDCEIKDGSVFFENLVNLQKGYMCATTSFFKNNIINKFGIFAWQIIKLKAGESKVLYFNISTKQNCTLKNIYDGEMQFVKCVENYKLLDNIKIETQNAMLDNLINEHLPSRILKNYIYNAGTNKRDFDIVFKNNFVNVSGDASINLKSIFIVNNNLGEMYLKILQCYLGVIPSKNGIFIFKNALQQSYDAKLLFEMQGRPFEVVVKRNAYLSKNAFVLNGVEFSNVKFLPYKNFSNLNKLILQL